MATLKLEIVTPEAVTFSEDVEMVTLPGVEGEMGIYPQHVPLMTQIVPGELVVRKSGQERLLAVGEGFVEITGESVSVLTDMAMVTRLLRGSVASTCSAVMLRFSLRVSNKTAGRRRVPAAGSSPAEVPGLSVSRTQTLA